MENPEKINFIKFLVKLLKAVKASEQSECHQPFEISESRINMGNHTCGTVHCVAGWYAVANCDTTQNMDYTTGANKMARDLGFISNNTLEDYDLLKRWAQKNPHLWGNSEGYYMFGSRSSYNPFPYSMRDVYNHWVSVYERLFKTQYLEFSN